MKTLEFSGSYKTDSLLIGNHEPVKIKIDGNFNISGLIYCNSFLIELNVSGSGAIKLRGTCKRFVLRKADGDCLIDLRELKIKDLSCELIRGNVEVLTGSIRMISHIRVEDNAVFRHSSNAMIISYFINGNARIERGDLQVKAL